MSEHLEAAQPMEKPPVFRLNLRLRLIALSLVLFTIALGFNVVFTSASLDKLYIDSMMSRYRVTVMDLQRKIETGLRYGKIMDNYYGLETLGKNTSQNIEETIAREGLFSNPNSNIMTKAEISLIVTTAEGNILYSDDVQHPPDSPAVSRVVAAALKGTSNSY